ncbi:HpcH/HpaI aldolase family protein [Ureibacillus manganicus]|uniref:HpcH/HpaI aldolase family protein n=1 Tax=Ureibacillus manganicus TaxID=1266064 RepID=UPI00068E23F4|nr:aldolase/citrate lyase family protein [Ureibacillus manganicus]
MAFRPKQNRILEAIRNGRVALGMEVYTSNPSLIEIIGYAGFDFYKLDMEHTRINPETMEHCIRAADAVGLTTLVKVPDLNPITIMHAIEAGAQAISVPHIKNREDARKAVSAVRYPPEGNLGSCSSIRSASYSTKGWDEYLKHHSSETMLMAVLEDKEAIDNVEEIFAELKPGVDAVSFGRGDLAQSLAKPGEEVDWDHPFVMEAYEKVLEVSKRTGIPVNAVPWPDATLSNVKAAIDKGAQICLYTIDQLLFYEACQNIVKEMEGILKR